jgi:hypothetical protein
LRNRQAAQKPEQHDDDKEDLYDHGAHP